MFGLDDKSRAYITTYIHRSVTQELWDWNLYMTALVLVSLDNFNNLYTAFQFEYNCSEKPELTTALVGVRVEHKKKKEQEAIDTFI